MSSLTPPAEVRGMTSLCREKFLSKVTVPMFKVPKENKCTYMQCCKRYYLKIQNFKPVVNVEEKDDEGKTIKARLIYLNPEKVKQWSDISEEDRSSLINYGVNECHLTTKEVELTYDNWHVDQIFRAVLPEGQEVSGYSQIGHIIHLNLRDNVLDYKRLIGEVLLDKIKSCRTVVNKSNTIDNTYRNFKMELLAGEDDFKVRAKENRCIFEFDFTKVYWNPRLGKEHERILLLLKQNDVLFDVFCGVGPFAVVAAKRQCKVFANDLNPDAFEWLNHNAKLNKVRNFKSYNDDGANFIQNIFKEYIKEYCNENKMHTGSKIHVTMNLPAIAVEFLKYFNGLLAEEDPAHFDCEIIVHVYCFAPGDDPESTAKALVVENIKYDITPHIVEVLNVRSVAPNKEMMRVSFRLVKDVLFGLKNPKVEDDTGPPSKKICIANTDT